MKDTTMPKADFVTSIVLMAFGAFIIITSLLMPDFVERGESPYSAPGLVSGLVGFAIFALALTLFIRSIVRKGYHLGITPGKLVAFAKEETSFRILITIAVSVIYGLVLLGRMHFVLSTGIYVFAFVMLFEYDIRKTFAAQWFRVLMGLVMAVLSAGTVYGVFTYLFLVDLP
jgi:hypothetical protein